MNYVNSSKFTYDKQSHTMVSDMSDLGNIRFQQICPDSADVGICIVSHRTGNEVLFYLDSVQENEGEIISWTLRKVDSVMPNWINCSRGVNPELKNLVVVIYND